MRELKFHRQRSLPRRDPVPEPEGNAPIKDDRLSMLFCSMDLRFSLVRETAIPLPLGRMLNAAEQQAEQQVLGADVVVVEQPRLFLGEYHDPAGPVGETLEQRRCLLRSVNWLYQLW